MRLRVSDRRDDSRDRAVMVYDLLTAAKALLPDGIGPRETTAIRDALNEINEAHLSLARYIDLREATQ